MNKALQNLSNAYQVLTCAVEHWVANVVTVLYSAVPAICDELTSLPRKTKRDRKQRSRER
jgi:hypothetical protein